MVSILQIQPYFSQICRECLNLSNNFAQLNFRIAVVQKHPYHTTHTQQSLSEHHIFSYHLDFQLAFHFIKSSSRNQLQFPFICLSLLWSLFQPFRSLNGLYFNKILVPIWSLQRPKLNRDQSCQHWFCMVEFELLI